ncbi:hypothetical protein A3B45_05565 [Candidatus Daviesbacteria bacterium RIFCSPLOWO2_01_FULL_39_12]|uniref:Uncharacterized protein n=1 Tax=Candidatus Daviesbacteria bacterium RIFCSPLOWO2_01_FULL_39_12 TaxID=1797785 RepID=A0A1F5KPG8_9BACT|nr:MAG: hypothetical protein A3B45_05565 [Candidatus Daviesbacteria bacterium RIFCSPLOWO2_01_FULL_39_12]
MSFLKEIDLQSPPQETKAGYEIIADPSFRADLIRFDGILEKNIGNRWPIAMSNFFYSIYSQALGLRANDMRQLLRDLQERAILTPLLVPISPRSSRSTLAVDKDRCMAVGALAHFIAKNYPRAKTGFLQISDPPSTHLWAEIVTKTKKALADNPLASFINDPREKPEFPPSAADKPNQLDPLLEVEEQSGLNQSLLERIQEKFPKLESWEEEALEQIGPDEVDEILKGLSAVSTAPVRGGYIPPYLTETSTFVTWTATGRLVDYDPDETYPMEYVVYQTLALCKNSLQKRDNAQRLDIRNMLQLLRATKTAAMKNPPKYWNSPRKVKIR